MLALDTFKDQAEELSRVGESLRRKILDQSGLDDSLVTLGEPPFAPVGGSSGLGATSAEIKLTLGTFFYLLDELPNAFRNAPISQFLQGQLGDESSAASDPKHVRMFTYMAGAVATAILTAHELCHALNGHGYIENYSKSPLCSEELGAEARRLQENEATAFAIEFNADLAGINWTLDALFDPSSQLRQMLEEAGLAGLTSPTGLGSLLAFVAVILAKTHQNSRRAKLRHPKPSVRAEALKRAFVSCLTTRGKTAERDAFLAMLPTAVEFLNPRLRPTVTDFAEALPSEPGDIPDRVERAWQECEPFLNKHKKGTALCFATEMRDWKKTLNW